jgi:hypothetical protein
MPSFYKISEDLNRSESNLNFFHVNFAMVSRVAPSRESRGLLKKWLSDLIWNKCVWISKIELIIWVLYGLVPGHWFVQYRLRASQKLWIEAETYLFQLLSAAVNVKLLQPRHKRYLLGGCSFWISIQNHSTDEHENFCLHPSFPLELHYIPNCWRTFSLFPNTTRFDKGASQVNIFDLRPQKYHTSGCLTTDEPIKTGWRLREIEWRRSTSLLTNEINEMLDIVGIQRTKSRSLRKCSNCMYLTAYNQYSVEFLAESCERRSKSTWELRLTTVIDHLST